MVLGNAHLLELWEITTKRGDDNDRTQIVWNLETRKIDHGGNRNLKELHSAEMATMLESGDVNYTLQYKPDDYPCWLDWYTWQRCYSKCTTAPGCPTPFQLFQPGYFPKKIVPPPEESCLPIGKNTLRFNTIQARITVKGIATITSFGVRAIDKTEASKADCDDSSECVALQCCAPSIWDYDSDPGDQSYYYSYWYGAGEQLESPDPEPVDDPSHEDGTEEDDSEGDEAVPDDTNEGAGDDTESPTIMGLEDWGYDTGTKSTWQPLFEGPESIVDPGVTLRPMGYSPSLDPPSGLTTTTVDNWAAAVRAAWAQYKADNGITTVFETMYWQYSGGDTQLKWQPDLYFAGDYTGLAAYEVEVWVAYTEA